MNILEQLTKALDDFNKSIEKDVAEIREQKNAVQQIKETVFDMASSVRYIRDDQTLILSAPNIIIGNVDSYGNLIGEGGGSTITLRGNNLSFEATGDPATGGTILSRAASIRNIAVDPGKDGTENVICEGRSEVVSQANGITLCSTNDKGAFVNAASSTGSGINISSETTVNVSATPSAVHKSKDIDVRIKSLEKQIKDLKTLTNKKRQEIDSMIESVKKISNTQLNYNDDEMILRTDYQELQDLQEEFLVYQKGLGSSVASYVSLVGQLAELSRCKKELDDMKKELDKKSDFKDKPTGSAIFLASEYLSIKSIDGDGNIRENKDAGMNINVPHLAITSIDKTGQLIKDSTATINTQKIDISTANANVKVDDKGKHTGTIKNEENSGIVITSKDITVQAIDQEYKDDKLEESALTEDSKFTLRTQNVEVSNTKTEGEATGKVDINAKDIRIAGMDLDKKDRSDKQVSADSQIVVLAKKTFIGSNKEKTDSELVQIAAKAVGIIGKETAEMQQDEAKAVLTLNGGNVTTGGSKVELKGNTTIEGNADIKGEAKAPKVSADQIEAKSAFKSPNINDTMGAGVPGQAGKISAKLKTEEPKKAEKKA